MAFHGRIPLELSYSVHHLGDDPAVIGSMDSLSGTAELALAAKSLALVGEGANSSWLHDGGFLHLQSPSEPSPSPREGRFGSGVGGQWLPRYPLVRGRDEGDADGLHAAEEPEASGGGEVAEAMWKSARYKAEILAHPLYEQLLAAHVACLRVATPVDQLPRIDAQLAQTRHVFAKYSALGAQMLADDKELDQFLVKKKINTKNSPPLPSPHRFYLLLQTKSVFFFYLKKLIRQTLALDFCMVSEFRKIY